VEKNNISYNLNKWDLISREINFQDHFNLEKLKVLFGDNFDSKIIDDFILQSENIKLFIIYLKDCEYSFNEFSFK
jgi:hypothetical protein